VSNGSFRVFIMKFNLVGCRPILASNIVENFRKSWTLVLKRKNVANFRLDFIANGGKTPRLLKATLSVLENGMKLQLQ
jgi:hypothetical protein